MLSFKINKKVGLASASAAQLGAKKPSEKTSANAFRDDEDQADHEPDFIKELDGNVIVSKKQVKTEKKELVIPLITKNEWRIDKKRLPKDESNRETEGNEKETREHSAVPQDDKNETNGESLKQQAIKELLEEASGTSGSDGKSNRSIPLLFQNKIPEGYEEDDNMDVSLRPDQVLFGATPSDYMFGSKEVSKQRAPNQSTATKEFRSSLEDYDRVPIEEFGLAMLRGMGWKESEGIGLKNKKVVDMAVPKLRPKGMGLGADIAHINKDVAPNSATKDNDNEKEDLTLKIGGYAMINRGSKKGYYGQIESFDEDNNRVILRLAIGGKMEAVSKFYIELVSTKEYKSKSKVINSAKYEEYKSVQENTNHHSQESSKRIDREDHRRKRQSSESSSEDDRDVKKKSERRDRYDSDRSSSRSDNEKDYKRNRRKHEDDYDSKYRKDDKTSHHKSRDRYEKSDSRDKKDRNRDGDRYNRRSEDRERRSYSDHHKSSSGNGEKRSSHHRNRDEHRERKHGHSHSSKHYRN